jgi:SAM domain (Sterile alpha motif)
MFAEQEITGDVLLELDVNLLKTEIGILAFGKRMRIANAIADLRQIFRPPSIIYSDSAQSPLKSVGSHQHHPSSYSYSHSHQSSLNSPASALSPLANSAFRGPESPMVPGSASSVSEDGHSAGAHIGLGFVMPPPNGKTEVSRRSSIDLRVLNALAI